MKSIFVFTAVCLIIVSNLSAQTTLTFYGSTGFYKIFKNHVIDINKEANVNIAWNPVGTGAGIHALLEHRADAAMTGCKVSFALNSLGLSGDNLVENIIIEKPLYCITYPNNPVKQLTWDQIKGLMSGAITNWKDVGGEAKKVIVFSPLKSDGARASYTPLLLNGESQALTARIMRTSADVLLSISSTDGSIALTDNTPGSNVAVINLSQPILGSLCIATDGDPSPAMQKVIEVLKKYAKNP